MESIITVIVSGLITGLFTLISKQMELNHSKNNKIINGGLNDGINYSLILRHIGVLQLVGNIIGFISGVLMAGSDIATIIYVVTILGTIGLSVGFYWIAKSIELTSRWTHLVIVAIGTGITTFSINYVVFSAVGLIISVEQLPLALIQPFVSMGIGGFIASFNKQPTQINVPSSSEYASPMSSPLVSEMARYSLYGRSGEMRGKTILISHVGLTIGRSSSNNLCLGEKSVSRSHAQLTVTPSGIYIKDIKSSFGTYVNNQKIQAMTYVLLRRGDLIQIGKEEFFEFRIHT